MCEINYRCISQEIKLVNDKCKLKTLNQRKRFANSIDLAQVTLTSKILRDFMYVSQVVLTEETRNPMWPVSPLLLYTPSLGSRKLKHAVCRFYLYLQ